MLTSPVWWAAGVAVLYLSTASAPVMSMLPGKPLRGPYRANTTESGKPGRAYPPGRLQHMDPGRKRALEEKVYAGERLSFADGVDLYASDDLAWLGRLAHHRRTEGVMAPGEVAPATAPRGGDRVMLNVNRHLTLTNVCSASCAYCSFQRKPGEKAAYTMRVEEAVAKALELRGEGLTELHIVNGLHPTLPWRYYPRVLRELKAALPEVSLKAFTATEIHWFER